MMTGQELKDYFGESFGIEKRIQELDEQIALFRYKASGSGSSWGSIGGSSTHRNNSTQELWIEKAAPLMRERDSLYSELIERDISLLQLTSRLRDQKLALIMESRYVARMQLKEFEKYGDRGFCEKQVRLDIQKACEQLADILNRNPDLRRKCFEGRD